MSSTLGIATALSPGARGWPAPAGSYLLVPAVRRLMLRQQDGWGAGAVVIDVGGPWPARSRADARELARAILHSRGADDTRQAWVRIHPPQLGEWPADLFALRGLVDGLVVPEVRAEHEIARLAVSGAPLLPVIETPEAVAAALHIARQPGVVRLAFSASGLAARLDARYSWRADRWSDAVARSRAAVVAASVSAGLPGPVNALQGEPEDSARLLHDAGEAMAVGFTAQCVSSPDQLPAVHDLLSAYAAS